MEMSHEAFNDPSYDPVLPQIPQDESLIHVHNGLPNPVFPQYHDSSLENFHIPSPESLQFTTGNAPTSRISTPSLSNQSQDTLTDLASPLLNQDSPVRSKPCTPQPQYHQSLRSPSSEESSFPPHLQSLNYFDTPSGRPHSSQYATTSSPGIGSKNHFTPPCTLHRRAHSQPPQEAAFFLPAHSSTRYSARSVTARLPPSYAERWRGHPYPRPSNRARDGPTSAPPTMQRIESPAVRRLQSAQFQEIDSPRFAKMQRPEEQSARVQSPRTIEVGTARIIVGSPLPISLESIQETRVGGDSQRGREIAVGSMPTEQVAAMLGMVSEIERQLHEGLKGCEMVGELLAKMYRGEGEVVEPLCLEKRSLTPSPVPEPDAFIESFPEVESAGVLDSDVMMGKVEKVG